MYVSVQYIVRNSNLLEVAKVSHSIPTSGHFKSSIFIIQRRYFSPLKKINHRTLSLHTNNHSAIQCQLEGKFT